MLSLVRSCLFRVIALFVVLLPVSMLVSRVSLPSAGEEVFTFRLSLAQPAHSSRSPPVSKTPPLHIESRSVAGTSVVGDPSLSAHFINQVLASAHSPAAGTGQALYDLSMQYQINNAYALAVFQKESVFGKYGAAFENHALGNIVCAGYPTCHGRFRWYPTWRASYQDFYQLIRTEYVAHGLDTVEEITPVYAPAVENDTGLYTRQVCHALRAFRSAQSLLGKEVPG